MLDENLNIIAEDASRSQMLDDNLMSPVVSDDSSTLPGPTNPFAEHFPIPPTSDFLQFLDWLGNNFPNYVRFHLHGTEATIF